MESFTQLAKDDPQRPQVLTDLRARTGALSINLQSEIDKCNNLLSDLPTYVDRTPHGGWMDALRGTLTEECRKEKQVCTSLEYDLSFDLGSTWVWSNEVLGVEQA